MVGSQHKPSCSGTRCRSSFSSGPQAQPPGACRPPAHRRTSAHPAPRPRRTAPAARGGTVTENRTPSPVRVDAVLDPSISRGLWLVKWLLLIPHFVVLLFLWIAFFAVSVVAFFAILFTARYPRAMFDFNVGVLRWTWRVHYYGYGALGTARYPPFTLAEANYPAHLDVAYPERLSRGLVLVKWWLLAIPQYVVVSILVGGGLYAGSRATTDNGWNGGWAAGGLVGLLVLIAAIALLFTARYPKPLYDLV